MNSVISIPVWRAPPCFLNKTSSPTFRDVTGITVFALSSDHQSKQGLKEMRISGFAL